MLEDTPMLTLEVNEKVQAAMGQRIRAVGMCFFFLKKGGPWEREYLPAA